ncbi:uncharacterized protein CLUP02_18404 [Colletotrichum lupini]|uniref:Uncharacterized protein n=1 Tax=Colletotrichum lupini TaxID=145971 RepID=A0A9Q8SGJ9_9PEZI|nr:uncharacterized protein CLUP02_18404 [Colletotrichum lupini]UQC76889.1 hypothetical protein CLUP02_18404 [Colletotrichum lupini]
MASTAHRYSGFLTLLMSVVGVDMQLCILHHRVQAQTMSNEVQTLYEFLGSDNPASSKTAEAVELDLWRAWDRHVAGARKEEKKGGRKIHELDEERSLFLAVVDVLMTRKEMRKYYDKVILLPLTSAVDREPVLRSLCGKHWLAMQ